MRVTQNLKNKIEKAKKDGYNYIAVSKTQNWNVTAYVSVSFDEILSTENGEIISTGWKGYFRDLNSDEIGYQHLFMKY